MGTKGPLARIPPVVDELCNNFLTGAALPFDERRGGFGLGNTLCQADGLFEGLALGDDPVKVDGFHLRRAQKLHFVTEPDGFEGLPNEQAEFIGVKGLGDVIPRTRFHGAHRGLNAALGGDHNGCDVGIDFFDACEGFNPIDSGQSDIEEDEIGIFAFSDLYALFSVDC